MPRVRRLNEALIILLILAGATATAAITLIPPPKHIGVNYLSLYHQYDVPTARLMHDFALFAQNGINTISIPLFWYRIEPSEGVYDTQFIRNVIRVIRIADRYGLSVMIDFHTLIGNSDAWSNPAYVRIGMNLITDPAIASDYIAMVKWTVIQLRGLPNIWAYSVINEPWYWPLESWRQSNWIDLIVQLSKVVKEVGTRPVTVRFVGALFTRDWAWNPELVKSLDFISINAYLDDNANQSIYWDSWAIYRAALDDFTRNASIYGKAVEITEFGYITPDDAVQEAMYNEYLEIFALTPNLNGWLSWGWDSSYDPNNPTWNAAGYGAVDIQSTGAPRPAFYVISREAWSIW